MFKKDLLKDKRILITGGGTGLGKEMANHFAEHGAELYICGRRANVLQETANEIIDKFETKVHTQVLDIRASKDVDDYVQSIFDDKPLDGLVNNAAEILFHLLRTYHIKDLTLLLTLYFMEHFI